MLEKIRDKFWELPLTDLNKVEWEFLCDHCGRCCLKKLQDEDSGKVHWTRIVCRYYQEDSTQEDSAAEAEGGCGCYGQRHKKVPDCLDVRQMSIEDSHWMPDTCAYRLRMENKPLPEWHPLLSGDRTAMRDAQISISGKALSEEHVHPLGYQEHIIRWVNTD